jgi:hypothetical protein
MDESIKKHIKEVRQWLEENVQVFPEPEKVTLSEFSVNWEEFSGEFRVAFDSVVLSEKLRFGLELSGKTRFYLPMFHSPLGAPASYGAIDISEKTHAAILKGLHQTIPKIKGAGIDRDTGREIAFYTPPNERIGADALSEARRKVNKRYSIEITVREKSLTE